MLEILGREYGIRSREALYEAQDRIQGIDIGIFTAPFGGRAYESEEMEESCACGQELLFPELT